jgi:hypothetical protein
MVGAQYQYLPQIFACIHKKWLTPLPSVVFQVSALVNAGVVVSHSLQGLIGMILCMPSNVEGLIDFFSFAAWIFYALTFLATLLCKYTKKNAQRVISVSADDDFAVWRKFFLSARQVPIPLIVAVILISIYLVIAPVVSEPSIGFLLAALMILSGLIFYYPFVYRKIEWKIVGKHFDESSVEHIVFFSGKINTFLITFFSLQVAQVNI